MREDWLPPRYELRERVGQGATGLVYRAWDRERGCEVAIKTLRAFSPEDAYRLKREFRSIAELSYPNLVQLYDLVASDERCFFTMEFVDGVTFVDWVRRGAAERRIDPGEAPSETGLRRLREALRQLALALGALHSAGHLHRDIKPSNVLVERDGRVVLLDLGFVSNLKSRRSVVSQIGSLVGTVAYMAPEQAAGEALTPAADWYSVGVVLYEALTGCLPFEGEDIEVLVRKRSHRPARPSECAAGAPEDLDALTVALLDPAPAERPLLRAVLDGISALPLDANRAGESTPADETFFVGRARELETLRKSFETRSRRGVLTIHVDGPSGIGKTALLRKFLADLEAREAALTLAARCHHRESVPYKAVDGIVDELSQFLLHQPPTTIEAWMPRGGGALARLFPVLARVPAIASADAEAGTGGDPHELRRRGFAELRELLGRIASRQSVALWIDDFQWGDLDSVDLLRALQGGPDPPDILLLLSYRSEDREASPALRSILEPFDDVAPAAAALELHLGPLEASEVSALARDLLGGAAVEHTREVETIAVESGGSPFLAGELTRSLIARTATPAAGRTAISLADMIAARVAGLPPPAQRLLELVAVAGRPIPEPVAIRAAEPGDDTSATLAILLAQSLLRTRPLRHGPAIEVYHDRIRETVVERMPPERNRQLHRQLAETLETLPDPDPDALVDHFLAANEFRRAGQYAYAAAERAARGLAFDRAAALYRRALDLPTPVAPRGQLHAKVAEAEFNAGRGRESARHFEQAAEEVARERPGDREILRFQRSAAEQYLRSGHIEDGLRVTREVLATAGLAYSPSPFRAILFAVLNQPRVRLEEFLYYRRAAKRRAAVDLAQLETVWSVGIGLSTFDAVRAAEYQVRHALLAYRSGDPIHVARTISAGAAQLQFVGGDRRRRRSARLHIEAQRLADQAGDPYTQALVLMNLGWNAYFGNRWREAAWYCDEGEALSRRKGIGFAWELANSQWFGASALAYLGEIAQLRERMPAMLQEARERDDYTMLTSLQVGMPALVWLAADDADEAQRRLESALSRRAEGYLHSRELPGLMAQAHIALYTGEPRQGWVRFKKVWPALRRSLYLRSEYVRCELRYQRARCALGMLALGRGEHGGALAKRERRRLLRFVARDARAIASESMPMAPVMADVLRAGVDLLGGRKERAAVGLERAALGFDRLEMALHAAAARHQAGLLSGGPRGQELRERQAALWTARGVVDHSRMAVALATGIPTIGG